MKKLVRLWPLTGCVLFLVAPALADWDVGDPYKMHFPQLPDLNGWDVNATWPKVLADDWMCTSTGPVTDIHFWGSWYNDQVLPIESIHLSIHADIPAAANIPISRPGALLWERDIFPGQFTSRVWGTGDQGWYNPNTGEYIPHNHQLAWQYNVVDIPDPFYQVQGTIYWLDISVRLPSTAPPFFGWKTSYLHFNDDAVWGDYPEPVWSELIDPITQQSLDMAFVITPEPGTLSLLLLVAGLGAVRRR